MKAIRFLLVLAIALGVMAVPAMSAKAGAFSYMSSIQVQNLDDTQASISLLFYDQAGNIVKTVSDTIAPLDKVIYFQTTMPVDAGFNGSVVVTSTTNVASISNVHGGKNGNLFWASGAYIAQNNGAKSVGIPLLMKGNSGYNTWFNVQNAGTGPANVTVKYTSGLPDVALTIPVGAAKTLDQAVEAHTAKIFAANLTSDQDIVVTVVEESGEILMAYNGFGAGTEANLPVFPLVHENNSGYTTNLAIQNRGASATTVTVTYYPNPGKGTQCTETQEIPANGSKDFAQFPFNGVVKTGITSDCVKGLFIGSARVTTNSANMPLVGVGNQWKGAINGSAYDGFNVAAASSKIVFPLIFDRRGSAKYQTTINMMNVGTTATKVTCSFTNAAYNFSVDLDPNKGYVDFENNNIANDYAGAGTCTASDNGQIVAIVNEFNSSATDDTLLTYEGINVAP